jgi:hypothetical protein
MGIILWLVEEMLAFQEGLCCLGLIGLWKLNRLTFTASRRLLVFRATRTASTPLRDIFFGPGLLLISRPRVLRHGGRFSAHVALKFCTYFRLRRACYTPFQSHPRFEIRWRVQTTVPCA